MNLDTLAADSAALASAAAAAEEALQLEREALSVLRDGWSGDSASAAAEFIDSHLREGEAVVSALRRASGVLADLGGVLGDPVSGDPSASFDQAQAELADRSPSAFASPAPPSAPPAASGMNWPAMPMPSLPDLGGAISNLIAQAADAFGVDAAGTADAAAIPEESIAETEQPLVEASPAPVADAIAAPPAGPEPDAATPLLAAEIPPPEPMITGPMIPEPMIPEPMIPEPTITEPTSPEPTPVTADADRTPCEIAADELPQIGQ